jgi:glycosyltransferase involved in cell wall biosynthesis
MKPTPINTGLQKLALMGDGESVHIVKWALELRKYFDLHIISFRGLHSELETLFAPEKVRCYHLTFDSDGGNIQVLKKTFEIARLIKKWKIEVVNAHYLTSAGLVAALAKQWNFNSFKLIQSTWGSDVLVSPKRNWAYRMVSIFALWKANFVTSDSEFMSQVIMEIYRCPVDTFPFGLNQMPKCQFDQKDPNLFFSNRGLNAIYRIDKVIDLFNELHILNPAIKLIIANNGNLKEQLIEKAKNLGISDSVDFVGFLDSNQQAELYSKAQFYLSLPESDSTAVSLLEAMGYGCIPILSDIPANHEWVKDQENGIIFKGSASKILEMLPQAKDIFNFNRNLIQKKAIFSDQLKQFLAKHKLI